MATDALPTAAHGLDAPMPTKAELAAAIDDLHALEVKADITKLATVALMCDVWSVVDDSCFDSRSDVDPRVLFGERLVSPGGEGTPEVAEFLALELGPRLHISAESAHLLIGDVLNLRHRLPILWEQALSGQVRAWAARHIARVSEVLPLTKAREFDSRLSPLAAGKTEAALIREAERMVAFLDDDRDERRARARAGRYAEFEAGADGTARLEARIDAAAAVHLDHTLDTGARTLAAGGVDGTHQALRAQTLELLAHPGRAHLVLDQGLPFEQAPSGEVLVETAVRSAGGPATVLAGDCRHGAELVVRVRPDEISTGVGGTLEGFGPVTRSHLAEILSGCASVVVRPVVDLTAPYAVAVYKPSPELRWRVTERDGRELFPFSNRRARSRLIDLDHTLPHARGGTTENGNLASLSRRAHRAVTHAGFVAHQETAGTLRWTTPLGKEFWTNAHGTWSQPPPAPGRINDPDDTTTAILRTALEIVARHRSRPQEAPGAPPDRAPAPPESDEETGDQPPPF